MDSKRKVDGESITDLEDADRAAKRIKIPSDDLSQGETRETTTYYGLQFLNQIKTARDKYGRIFCTIFYTLPDKNLMPDYFERTKMPIALDTIERKLNNFDFSTLSELECYFKRFIKNNKDYYDRDAPIHRDAERVRKALVAYMTKTNPEYQRTPGLRLEPTPITIEDAESDLDAEGEIVEEEMEAIQLEAQRKLQAQPQPQAKPQSQTKPQPKPESQPQPQSQSTPVPKRRGRPPKNLLAPRKSTTPAVPDSQYLGVDFSGLNFQQAQEKVIADVLSYKEDPADDYFDFEPFVSLPPRSLKDYYQVIPNPHCLKDLQKRVKGTHGKAATGVSDFKTWAAFEEDASLIWKNAYHYNEDGSDIFLLAKDLEAFFLKKLSEAKRAVPEPIAPKIKINVKGPEPSPKITLRVGGNRAADSPAPQTNGPNGVTPAVTSATSSNGETRRNPFSVSNSSTTAIPSLDHLERARSMSNSAASPTPSNSALVKNEDPLRNSPSMGPTQTMHGAMSQTVSTPTPAHNMPPPHTPGATNHSSYNQNGYAQSFNHQPTHNISSSAFESKWRAPGKDASHAMITNLSLVTHPKLNLSQHFSMDLPPSATMAQQSITINLPSTHYYLLVKPTIAESLLQRQYKLFVTTGTVRLHALPLIPGHGINPRYPLFEARLFPGVNKIEIELIAALPKGAVKPPGGQDVEIEKITVFANLMKS